MTKAYISATQKDLLDSREVVHAALRRLGIDDVAMDAYVADGRPPLARCLADVAQCDIYIGLFAWRYGFRPPGHDKSITELEYREALRLRKACYIFLLAEDAPWPVSLVDRGEDADAIAALREELRMNHVCSFFRTAEELGAQVTAALANYRDAREDHAGGAHRSRVLPGFAGETSSGEELLGVDLDALALATLVGSRSLSPPLAIGIHGPWGSGKTFFMNVMARHLRTLAETGDRDAFCRQTVCIWFNAWHYAEGNLWASLLHHIFLSLHERPSAPQQALNDALAMVEGIQETTHRAAVVAREAEAGATRARRRLQEVQAAHRDARARASAVQGSDVWSAVVVDEQLRARLNAVADELGIPGARDSARDLVRAIADIRLAIGRSRQLATAGVWWRSPLVLGLLVAVGLAGAGVVAAALVDWKDVWLGPAVAVFAQLTALAGGAGTWLFRQAALVRRLLEPAEEAQRRIDERLAELEAEQRVQVAEVEQQLVDAEAAVADARRRLAEAESQENVAKTELQQLTGGRLLRRYLSERVTNNEYGEYLGMVALAHRDLRDLDAYLRAAADDSESPVDRIVLYIDDLDRCQPEVVVRVLEAVNLLLALPLFVVVVGVDAALLTHSLNTRHPVLLGAGAATPQDYLDKIFQLTYRMRPVTAHASAAFLRRIATSTQARRYPAAELSGATGEERTSVPAADVDRFADGSAGQIPAIAAPDEEILELADFELDALEEIAPLVGSSPRRAKRFLNMYRVAKARVLTDRALPHEQKDEFLALLLLVALAAGLPGAVSLLEQELLHLPVRRWLEEHQEALGPERVRLREFIAHSETFDRLSSADLAAWIAVVGPFVWSPTADPLMYRRV